MLAAHEIYGGRDPREIPAYGISDAAYYLDIPRGTLRDWVLGQPQSPYVPFPHVIEIADAKEKLLSFWNLFEAYVLDSLRREHEVPLPAIRNAVAALRQRYPQQRYPLVHNDFVTFGKQLFVEEYGRLVNLSQGEQYTLTGFLDAYLKRVERDADGLVERLYPFSRKTDLYGPKVIVIDPTVRFGRPVLTGTRIPTSAIASRARAGVAIEKLAADYGKSRPEIEEALAYERYTAA